MIGVPLLYALAGIVVFGIGLFALVVHVHPVRRILAVNVMGSGVFLVLLSLARRGAEHPDPVPQAMALTGIVIAVSATGVALFLAVRIHGQSSGDSPRRQ